MKGKRNRHGLKEKGAVQNTEAFFCSLVQMLYRKAIDMRITDKFKSGRQLISFEVFPPKTDANFESIEKSVRELALYAPDFMSVTYGAGGGTSKYTVDIASMIKNELDTTALAHITCASTTKEKIFWLLAELKSRNVDNILALRGDLPPDFSNRTGAYYEYASDLVTEIKKTNCFDIGGACYPSGHPEAENLERDIENLKIKVGCGVDFLITQLFFDNKLFLDYSEKLRARGISVPVIAGIMPITSISQIDRTIALSSADIPKEMLDFAQKYKDSPESFKEAGLSFAVKQINELLENGVDGIHIYTMNKPFVAKYVLQGIKR